MSKVMNGFKILILTVFGVIAANSIGEEIGARNLANLRSTGGVIMAKDIINNENLGLVLSFIVGILGALFIIAYCFDKNEQK